MEEIPTDNLAVALIVKNSPTFLEPNSHRRIYKTPLMDAVLSQIIPVHTYPICFKIHINIIHIHVFTPRLSSCLFPSGCPVEIMYASNVPPEF
jgi:hypothetical protein